MDISINKKIVDIWFSIFWRTFLVGAGIGFVLGLLWGLMGGSSSDISFKVTLNLIVTTYGSMLAIKMGLKANNINTD